MSTKKQILKEEVKQLLGQTKNPDVEKRKAAVKGLDDRIVDIAKLNESMRNEVTKRIIELSKDKKLRMEATSFLRSFGSRGAISKKHYSSVVSSFLELCSETDVKLRSMGVNYLLKLGWFIKYSKTGIRSAAIAKLLELTKDRDKEKQKKAIQIIGRIGESITKEHQGAIVSRLLELTVKPKKEDPWSIHHDSVGVLSDLGPAIPQEQHGVVVDRLMELLKDPNERMRKGVLCALGSLKDIIPQDQRRAVMTRLRELFKDPGNRVAPYAHHTHEVLVKAFPLEDQDTIVTNLQYLCQEPDVHFWGAIKSIEAQMEKMPKEQHGIVFTTLLDFTKESNADARKKAIKMLWYLRKKTPEEFNKPITERFLELLCDPDESVGQEVADLCHTISKENLESILPRLLELTRDPNGAIRANAVKTVRVLGKGVEEKYGEAIAERLDELISDPEGGVRAEAIKGLGDYKWKGLSKKKPDSGITRLLELTEDADIEVRKEAAKKLGEFGGSISPKLRGPVVIRLLDLCGEEDEDMKKEAGESLKKLSKHWNLVKTIPSKQRDDVAKRVLRLDAEESLYYIEIVESQSTKFTLDFFYYPLHKSLFPAFKQLWSGKSAFSLLMELAQDEDPAVRKRVVKQFIELWERIPSRQQGDIIAQILEMTNDPDKSVRLQAKKALKALKK